MPPTIIHECSIKNLQNVISEGDYFAGGNPILESQVCHIVWMKITAKYLVEKM